MRRAFTTLLLAGPVAGLWVLISSHLSLESIAVGYLLGLAVVIAVRPSTTQIRWRRLHVQVASVIVFTAQLFRDIVLSGIDVARRVLSRDMRLQPGIIAVDTQDPRSREIVAALSAAVITLTPGELVVEIEGTRTLFVHCLDVETSAAASQPVQAQRLAVLRQIMGDETDE
jgi:multisubunit Na+/H+ antiporter MnhE subunit